MRDAGLRQSTVTDTEYPPDSQPIGDGGRAARDVPPTEPRAGETASFTLGPDGRVRSWNRTAESLTGWDDDVVDEHVSVLFADGDDGLDNCTIDAALDSVTRTGHFETGVRCVGPAGALLPASVTITPRSGNGDGPAEYTVVLRDETARTQVADERRLLAAVSREVARAESFAGGVETVLAAVCDHTQWAYGEAWVPADDGQSLEYVVGHAADTALQPFLNNSTSVTLPAGEGLPGRVYASGMPEWIPDASEKPESVFSRAGPAADVGLRAALGIPITTGDRVVAVLAFFLRERREADDRLVEVVTDVAADLGGLMARKRTDDALAQERALLGQVFETSPVGLLVADTDGTIERANREVGEIAGRPPESLAGRRFESVGEYQNASDETVPGGALPVARALETGETIQDVELRLSREDGEHVWVRVSASPIRSDDGSLEGVTVALEDVTEHREREQSLRTFREAVEQAGHSIYVTDPDGTIQYVNPAFEAMTGYSAAEATGQTPNILNSGEHDKEFFADLWGTILDGGVWTGEVVNERKSGEQYVINQTIAPIVDDAGEIEQFVAVNDEITEQKRRERTLRRQRNSLERVRQILESLRPINRELARAGTREEIDRIVCEQLAASDAYLFAWVGDYNRAAGQIEPREWAGIADGFVDALDLSVADGFDRGPFDRAVSEQKVCVLREITTDPASETRRNRAITYGYQSVAAVPVTYGETVLGVIGVYSARREAFDKYERGLLRELGERIGHAINAAENKRLLQADTIVEVEFEVGTADSAFASVAAALDCQLSVTSVTPTDDRGYLCYVAVDGEPPAAVVEALADRTDVGRARVVRARGDTGVVEAIVWTGPTPALLEHGATIRSLEAAEGGATLTAETAPQSDVGALISDLEAANPATVFLAKRTHTREAATLTMTQTAVEETLTDRQREVLALAYHAGFFESPRDSTGEELAGALGISAPTLYQHVRKGVRKILGLLVDADSLRPAPARDERPVAAND